MSKIAILGSTGMLGSTLARFLTTEKNEIYEFSRKGIAVVKGNRSGVFDVTSENSLLEFSSKHRFDFAINAIGLIKQLINEDDSSVVNLAYAVNRDFPAFLNQYSIQTSTPIIQIGTDCVYSGQDGDYNESSKFDCTDVYGKSKVEGENLSQSLLTIRSSIVGHELSTSISLMDWFTSQPNKAEIKGYTNHYWNGVTTLDFSRIVQGVIDSGAFFSGTFHLVPADKLSKYELLKEFADSLDRMDLTIEPFVAEISVNRTLSTLFPEKNSKLWAQAGYNQPPTVKEMVNNYALWSRKSS